MKKILKWILGLLIAGFLALQFTNPSRKNPAFDSSNDLAAGGMVPPKIAATLRAACYDCHSDETKWPWYSHVAPISWPIADDVNRGRARLNFSEWPNNFPDRAAKRLEDISEELDYNEMPPAKYTLLHPEARLTAEQRKELSQWVNDEVERLKLLSKKEE